jgi:hypothetical protein
VQSARGFGGDLSGIEVGLQGRQQRFSAPAGLRERVEYGVDEVDDRGLVAA